MRNKFQTSFPMARIKRIMQRDDQVGKVALAAPLAISKALEIFMSSLLSKGVEIVRKNDGRRLLPAHLKRSVDDDKLFDFLTDIVKDIPDIEPTQQKGGEKGSVKRRRESTNDASTPTRRRVSKAAQPEAKAEASSSAGSSSAVSSPPHSPIKLTLSTGAPPLAAPVKVEGKPEEPQPPAPVVPLTSTVIVPVAVVPVAATTLSSAADDDYDA